MALFPVPAHRTGQALFAHPALGESSRGRPRKTARPLGQPDEAKLIVQGGFWKLPLARATRQPFLAPTPQHTHGFKHQLPAVPERNFVSYLQFFEAQFHISSLIGQERLAVLLTYPGCAV